MDPQARRWIEHWPIPGPDDEEELSVSPFAAYVLTCAFDWLAERWQTAGGEMEGEDDGEREREREDLRAELPRIAEPYLLDGEFCQRMAASAGYLARELRRGHCSERLARCTGDEINFHLACCSFLLLADLLPASDEVALTLQELAPLEDVQSAVADLQDLLLRDLDVTWLWEPAMDGIEDDEELLERMGIAPMRPEDWFVRFGDV